MISLFILVIVHENRFRRENLEEPQQPAFITVKQIKVLSSLEEDLTD